MKKEKEELTLEEKFEKLLENDEKKMSLLEKLLRIAAKKEIMFSEDVCDTFRIKPRALSNWRRDGKIPFMRPGKVAMYSMSKVLEHFESITKDSAEDTTENSEDKE